MPHFVIFGLIIYLIVQYWQFLVVLALLGAAMEGIAYVYHAFMSLDRYVIHAVIIVIAISTIRFIMWLYDDPKTKKN